MIQKIWDVNPSIGGPILRNKIWFNYTFRHCGSTKTKTDAYFDKNPSQFVYDPDFTQPGLDDGHIVSNAGRISWQVCGKDKISVYHDNQRKYRDHWGIAATIPPEAAGVQVTPTSSRQRRRSGRARTPTSCCSKPASDTTTRNTPSSISRASPAPTRRSGTTKRS